jgi:uncharacterized protein YjbI with pentapeptide repeats
MKVRSEKRRMEVHRADLSGPKFGDANLAGASITNVRLDGAPIEGIAVTDLRAYWRAGHEAKSA